MIFSIFGLGSKKGKEFLYEPILLTDCIAAGYVPCTIRFNGECDSRACIKITRTDGIDQIGTYSAQTARGSWAGSNGDYINWGDNLMNYDLESYYKGDYAKMETITNITCTRDGSSRNPSISVVRYYKKSSGGGFIKTAFLSVLRAFSCVKGKVKTMLFNIPLMGKKDVNRPYPGYKIAYGSMTLAACRSAGYIPLTIKVTNDASNLSAGDYRGVSIQGVDSGIRLKTSGSATLTAQNYHIDLDSFYSGNLSKCKAVSSIKQLELEGSLYSPSFTYSVVKWLVPEV